MTFAVAPPVPLKPKVVASIAVCAASAWGQVEWTQPMPTTSPSPAFSALAYDAARKKTLHFGEGATWAWDGTDWSQLSPATNPPPRGNAAMAYDGRREVIVLFGGRDGTAGTVFGDTWEWNGTDWTLRVPIVSPQPRQKPAIAYDASPGTLLLFGGWDASGTALNDTWRWDGTTWTELAPAASPPARGFHAMVHIHTTGRTIMFGGMHSPAASSRFDDTWDWDGTTWAQLSPAISPSPRDSHAIVYDDDANRAVLFGGWSGAGGAFNDTWEWDGTNWRMRSTSTTPAGRYGHGLAYDSDRKRIVLFGGWDSELFGETWEYSRVSPGSYMTFGTGCGGAAGTPTLRHARGPAPYIGDSFTITLGSLPPSIINVPFGLLGGSNSMWGPATLPLDMSVIGMIGCQLYVSIDLPFTLLNTGGTASWNISVPNNAALVGRRFYQQVLVLDVSAPGGAVVSNAGEAVIGSK